MIEENICVTNPNLTEDGFGANFQMIIYSLFYAEKNKLNYVYNPFKNMDHNYDSDPDFIEKKEKLINFRNNYKIYNENDKNIKELSIFELLSFFEKNIEKFPNCNSIKKIKKIFKENKVNNFDKNFVNIAIHIRRQNKADKFNRGTNVPIELYLQLIEHFSNQINNLRIHVYSQGDILDFSILNKNNNVIFHLNENIEDTFTSMVFADILVTAPSAFSYTAGLISDNNVWYIEFCNRPLSNWTVIQNYKSNRMKHEYLIPMLTSVNYDPLTGTFEKIS